MPCQLGVKTSRDENKHTTNQLSAAQMVATSCVFLFSQWRMELMTLNMIHLLAALPTATFSQGRGTLNYQLAVGKGLSCRSGPSQPPPRQSWHFHFIYRKLSTAHDKLQTSSLWPRPWLHLSSLQCQVLFSIPPWCLNSKNQFISRLYPQLPCIFSP